MNLKRIYQFVLMLFCLHATSYAQELTNVVCVGNSITEGYGLQAGQKAWPEQLADLLGDKYKVINCGRSGTTMLKSATWAEGGSRSYWGSDDHGYGQAKRSNPDIVIIALGTNDASVNYNVDEFKTDYTTMINEFKAVNGQVKLYLCLPPTIYNGWDNNLVKDLIPAIQQVATATGSSVINLHDITANHRNDLYNDDLHPNVNGAGLIARTVYDAIKNNGGKITPYVQNTYGDWYRDEVIHLESGDKFMFGPQPNYGGNWYWTGPNGFSANTREISIQNVNVNNAGTYHVTYRADDGTVSGHTFTVAVDGRLSANVATPNYPANSIADLSYAAYTDAFLRYRDGRLAFRYGYKGTIDDVLYCWPHGLVIMMLEDRYRFRGDEMMKPIVTKILDTFTKNEDWEEIKNEGVVSRATQEKFLNLAHNDQNISCWTWNFFNDDILWMGLPYIRCYLMTHQKRYLDQAKWLFDYLNERAWDDAIGGGYWWSMDNDAKSGLSNNPAMCLSVYLYEATGEQKYLDQAKKIFDWVYRVLRNPDGSVDENINVERTDYPRRVNGYTAYNAGTFIEGASGLYRVTGEQKYLDAARGTLDWMMTYGVNDQGIVSRGQGDGTYQSELCRGAAFLMEAAPYLWDTPTTYGRNKVATTYYKWLRMMADRSWEVRDKTYNLTDTDWSRTTTFDPNSKAGSEHAELFVSSVVTQQVVPVNSPGNNANYLGQDTRITPYSQLNDGEWKQNATVQVKIGDKVKFGPHPNVNNNWSWIGPNGLSVATREITLDNIQPEQLGLYQASYVNDNGRIISMSFIVTTDSPYDESIAITPYVQDKYGWQQKSVIGINAGEGFALGPQANVDGSWSWTGPDGFKSYSREFSLANTTTAQGGLYTVTLRTNDGRTNKADIQVNILNEAKPGIIPYMNGHNAWEQTTQMSVNSGNRVEIGPQAQEGADVGASRWDWVGPNNFRHTGRDFTLNNISKNESGTYTLYFNDLFGRRIVEKFVVTVDGYANPDTDNGVIDITETDINEVETTKAGTVYYDLRGVKVNKPVKGVYITNGKKVVVNK